MNRIYSFFVAGGDMRQAHLARQLHLDGHNVSVYALERQNFPSEIFLLDHLKSSQVDAVILPLPLLQDSRKMNAPLSNAPHPIEEVLSSILPGSLVLGGSIPEPVYELAKRNDLKLIDYLNREELAILNAIPTAEGALQIAMEELPITLHKSRCLVIGNGRIGKILSHMLRALGANVTVSARSVADFARIYADGNDFISTDFPDGSLGSFQVIFNTVPSIVLKRIHLSQLSPDCLVVELASKPGGIDLSAAEKCQRKVIQAASLPGKVAPLTSALAIKDTIYNILKEEKEELH